MPAPPKQLGLFDPVGARKARDAGIALVTNNNLSWYDQAVALLSTQLGSGTAFTGETARAWLEPQIGPPKHPNLVGAVMRHFIKRGLVQRVGERNGKTIKSHARRVLIWRF
jgi:hypothetical protein